MILDSKILWLFLPHACRCSVMAALVEDVLNGDNLQTEEVLLQLNVKYTWARVLDYHITVMV